MNEKYGLVNISACTWDWVGFAKGLVLAAVIFFFIAIKKGRESMRYTIVMKNKKCFSKEWLFSGSAGAASTFSLIIGPSMGSMLYGIDKVLPPLFKHKPKSFYV